MRVEFHDPYEPRGRWYRIVAAIGLASTTVAWLSLGAIVVLVLVVLAWTGLFG